MLEPVADSDNLSNLLERCSERATPLSNNHFSTFLRAFGSLVSALTYIHKSFMRHKDIAPSNILIHRGKVLLSDFGTAFAFVEGYSATYGIPSPAYNIYKASEVNNRSRRGRSADIWSLGYVYFEILSVLNKAIFLDTYLTLYLNLFRDKKKYFQVHTLLESKIKKLDKAEEIEHGIPLGFRSQSDPLPKVFYVYTRSMILWNPSERPTAMNILCQLCQCFSHNLQDGRCEQRRSSGLPDCVLCTYFQMPSQHWYLRSGGTPLPYHARSPRTLPVMINNDFHYLTTDKIVKPPLNAPKPTPVFDHMFDYSPPRRAQTHDDEAGPDILRLSYQGKIYPLYFAAYSIAENIVKVADLREKAALEIGCAGEPYRITLRYKGKKLGDDNRTCREEGLKQLSAIACRVREPDSKGNSSHQR